MQTFLPYPDFAKSAFCLDNKRLGKQRLEVVQILRTLQGVTHGYANHPAVKMWRGHERALIHYGMVVNTEWVTRGFADHVIGPSLVDELEKLLRVDSSGLVYPPWFGDNRLHESHQSSLVRKLPEHYRKYFPAVADNIPNWWPVK